MSGNTLIHRHGCSFKCGNSIIFFETDQEGAITTMARYLETESRQNNYIQRLPVSILFTNRLKLEGLRLDIGFIFELEENVPRILKHCPLDPIYLRIIHIDHPLR